MNKTINEVLVYMKTVRERIKDLKELRVQSANKETYYSAKEKMIEPTYDIKELDKKIVELQNWCSLADAKIKMSNAVTTIEIDLNLEGLLSPLK